MLNLLAAEMTTQEVVILFSLTALAVATILSIQYILSLRRTAALRKIAQELGFDFVYRTTDDVLIQLPDFELFYIGDNRQLTNWMRGSAGDTHVHIFDWTFMTGHGRQAESHACTVMLIDSDEVNLPIMHCRPVELLERVGLQNPRRTIGFDRPEFRRKFLLSGDNEVAIRRIFDVEVCEFFEAHPGIHLGTHGRWLLYFSWHKLVAPARMPERFKAAFNLFSLLKHAQKEVSGTALAAGFSGET